MNSINLFKKIIASLLALCAFNGLGMQKDPWAYFAAESNGHQLPLASTEVKKPEINWDWNKKCAELNKDQFLYELEQFFKVENKGMLANAANWISGKMPSEAFVSGMKFEPYVMKLEINPETEISFHGDIHGDKDSLIAYLIWLAENGYTDLQDPFKIIKDNFYIIFLGDYTDRGKYGPEVIYTILRLKRTNPDKVFMVRGNHEDIGVNIQYGFKNQLDSKFNDDETVLKAIDKMYNYLPVALYLVCNNGTDTKDAILCCHGGIEVGFEVEKAKALLSSNEPIKFTILGNLYRKTNCQKLPQSLTHDMIKNFPETRDFKPVNTYSLHFLWNDFDVKNICTTSNPGRAWECDKSFTDFVNEIQSSSHCKIRGVFRGHQHGDLTMMNRILNRDQKNHDDDIGVGKLWITGDAKPNPGSLWDGIVCTFSVCPNTGYGKTHNYTFNAFGILKTANLYTNWKLQMHRISPIINN